MLFGSWRTSSSFTQLVAYHGIARGLVCANVGKTVHNILILFDVIIGWLDRRVAETLGELVKDRVVYLDCRDNLGLGGNRPS